MMKSVWSFEEQEDTHLKSLRLWNFRIFWIQPWQQWPWNWVWHCLTASLVPWDPRCPQPTPLSCVVQSHTLGGKEWIQQDCTGLGGGISSLVSIAFHCYCISFQLPFSTVGISLLFRYRKFSWSRIHIKSTSLASSCAEAAFAGSADMDSSIFS